MDNNLGQVVLVKDINPDFFDADSNSAESSSPSNLFEFNDKLYFSADDGENDRELFVSDGTAGGTQLLVDLNSGSGNYYSFYPGSSPGNFIEFNNRLYFTANDSESGRELFVSDGTAEGTQLLVDLRRSSYYPTGYIYGSSPDNFIEFNNRLYFTANNGENGRELFVSDGTRDGTQLLVDLNPSSSNTNKSSYPVGSRPSDFVEFNNKLYFSASGEGSGRELFVSDGTVEGTQLLVDLNPNVSVFSGYYYGSYYSYPLSSDPRDVVEFNDKLYFTADNGENGRELFVSDGTADGTQLLADLRPGSNNRGSSPDDFVEFNDKLYFIADNGENGRELFVSDGTRDGTQLLVDLNPSSNYYSNSNPGDFIEFNDKLYFTANDGENGRELFVSDGTRDGTQLLVDLNPDSSNYGSDPSSFIEFNDKLYFTAFDGSARKLYVTDGTVEGTQVVADIDASNLTVVGNELFFSADDGEVGRELFKLTFDGTVTQALNPISGTAGDDNLVGTDGDNEISGDRGNDGITGESGDDVLSGKLGNDVLDGGAGNDTLNGGAGTDTAVYQFDPGSVTVSLNEAETLGTAMDGYGDTDSLADLENVIGSEFDDNLTGNSGNNSLTGRGGNDTILGLAGDDFLTGSTGVDTLSGGEGSDRFVYFNASEGGDTINDFLVGTDKILIVSAGFGGGLSAGELPPSSFGIGNVATSSEQRFIFDDARGELFFDVDGSGAATGELITSLDGVSNLSAEDIMLL